MSFETDDKSNQNSKGFDDDQVADQAPYAVVGTREFATQADLEKFYESATTHITKLESENSEFREREAVLSKAAEENVSARELLEGIKQAGTQTESSVTPSKTSEEIIAEAVAIATHQVTDNLKNEAQKALEDKNLSDALASAEKAFGAGYHTNVKSLATEHGLTLAQVDNLAKTSPIAFRNLFIPADKATGGPTDTEFNSSAFTKQQEPEKPKSIMAATDNKTRAAIIEQRIQAKMKQA